MSGAIFVCDNGTLLKFTERERTILLTLAETAGTNKEIGEKLGLGEGSVKVYMVHVRNKLECHEGLGKSRLAQYLWAKDHQEGLTRGNPQ